MRFKTTNKVINEIVLSGLNLILKKNSFFDVSKDKIGHHELVWAIHSGYVSAVDEEAGLASSADKKCYVNKTKKTIVCSQIGRPIGQNEKVVLLAEDPVCREMDKLVSAGILVLEKADDNSVKAISEKEEISISNDSKESAKKEVVRKSFKKSSTKAKNEAKVEEKKGNNSKTVQLNSDSKVIVTKPDGGQVFIDNNNEELEIDQN